jgi:hypothetical protein
MKKILLGALLLLSISMSSQEKKGTFVTKYTSFVIVKNNVYGKLQYANVTVVYNENDTNDIGIYLTDSKILLYSSGKIETGKTTSGQEYQFVKCIAKENGNNVGLQLFENTLRLFTNESYTDSIEFYK